MNDFLEISNHFKLEGKFVSCVPYGNGHINKTYLLKTTEKDYILQQINSYAFKDVSLLMNNIYIVTSYLESIKEETMVVIKTIEDNLYYQKDNDTYYRVYEFVGNSICYETVESMDMLTKDGYAFGSFHNQLSGLDSNRLSEVIPNFHNTPVRFNNLKNSIQKDKLSRLDSCKKEVDLAFKYKDNLSLIMDGLNDGSISQSISHNDPKINNILFDATTGDVRVVIDLDTVMPGSVLFDIGDTFRSLFTGKYEDSKDLSFINIDYDKFRAYMKGYLMAMKDKLTKREIELIPYSAFLLTYECGIRFLADYLDGDVYFHTTYPEHNLVRCRTQLKLADDIYNHMDKLSEIIKELI